MLERSSTHHLSRRSRALLMLTAVMGWSFMGCRAQTAPKPYGEASAPVPSALSKSAASAPVTSASVFPQESPAVCASPPWVRRSVLDEELLKRLEQPGPAACESTVSGTVRRIRNSLFFDGPVEANPYDEAMPEDMRSWGCAPVLLWPSLPFRAKNPLAGWSSVAPGEPGKGIPHMVVWSGSVSSMGAFDWPEKDARDYLLALDESTLTTKVIHEGRPGERLRLMGRWGELALLLSEFEGKLTAVSMSGAGKVVAQSMVSKGPKSLEYSHAELDEDVYEPIDERHAALLLDVLYLVSVRGNELRFASTKRPGLRIARQGETVVFVIDDEGREKCVDLRATQPSAWATAPTLPCPENLERMAWYEHSPLPVNGKRTPFVANVAGCQVRTALRLGSSEQNETYRPEGEPDEQLLRVNMNETALDNDLHLDIRVRAGHFRDERLSIAIGKQLPRYHDRSVVWRFSIPPQAIQQRTKEGPHHRLRLSYPGFIAPWPNDCHEGSLIVRAEGAMVPYSLMWGYCE